jgi:putative phosphoribosyl transferase
MRFYRGERPFPGLEGRSVLVVDDGIATGYTMRAAVLGLRRLNPRQLIVAVPVAPSSTCEELAEVADEVVCLETPEPFYAVGAWYEEFDQTSDEEVIQLLDRFGVRSAA